MKLKNISTLLLISAMSLSTSLLKAQTKITEGVAVFNLEFPTEGMDEQYKAMMPTESKIYFKGDKSRSEMEMSVMTMVSITDTKDKSMIMLMDVMGKKTAMKTDLSKTKEAEKNYKVNVTDETKTIAGYKCIKATVTDDEGTKFDVWFTKEIEGSTSGNMQFKDIDGFLMSYEMPVPNMEGNMKMECKSVKAEKVSDDKFTIPAGYELKTQEELMKGR
jgi:GLPGLI family protein